jgi:amidase
MLSAIEDEKVVLPVGMQITGKWFDEAMVYRIAAAWEGTFDWKKVSARKE